MDNKPIIFSAKKQPLEAFQKEFEVSQIIDRYRELLEDLFLIQNPKFRFNKNHTEDFEAFLLSHVAGKSLELAGMWVYFPWNKQLVHYLTDELHQELRTARNKNLITKKEQNQFYNFNVGVAGLSVGSHAALTLAMVGGARVLKLADYDTISGTNLNRIRTDFTKIGINKCDWVTEQVYQINPYAEIYSYNNGITENNLVEFLSGPPKLDALIECIDNPELKIKLRLEAKKLGIPVIMATDNGDNIIFDIERYDLNPNLQLFNGILGDLTLEEFQKYKPQELPKVATKLAGADMVVPRMLESVSEVGKTLYSWPQLGNAATLAGVALTYVIKRLALKQNLKQGKLEVNLDSIFDPNFNSPAEQDSRNRDRKKYLDAIGF